MQYAKKLDYSFSIFALSDQLLSKKPPTTGDRLRAQHQWHARFARGGFSTMIFPIKKMATPPVKIH